MRPSANSSLSTIPLPSIALVLTSNLPDISTRPLVTNCDQHPFPVPQMNSEHGIDQQDAQTFESPKKRKTWLYILRRRSDSSASSIDSTSFFSNAVRRLILTRAGAALFSAERP